MCKANSSANTSQNIENVDGPIDGFVEVLSSSCWHVQGTIEKLHADFLVDTGSTYTVIDKDFYELIPEFERPPLQPIKLKLKSANGEMLRVYGQADLNLGIGNHCFKYPVKVVALGDRTAILGLDFMNQEDCVLHLAHGLLQIKSQGFKVSLKKSEDNFCARVQVSDTIHVPAWHEMLITCDVNDKNRQIKNRFATVEPAESLCEEKGLLMANAVVNSHQKHVPVRLVNFGNTTVTLQKGYTVALLKTVSEEEISNFGELSTCREIKSDVPESENINSQFPEHLQSMIKDVAADLNEDEVCKIKKLIMQYQHCFMAPDGVLGRTNLVKHTIDTGNAVPVKQRFRNPPLHLRDEVDRELEKLQTQGLIEDSDSPWSSPLVIVPKKDKTLRVCVDYRRVNDLTMKKAYPLPKISDCLDTLAGAKYFCSLDLASGYHQVAMEDNDKPKTAFSTRRGLKQFTVLPFGLTGAPSTFERLMEMVLSGLQWEQCVLYLDDVLCFGESFETTLSNLELILKRFETANLKLKPSKCKMFQTSVEFLGHIVSSNGVSCDPKKISAVVDWPRPKNVKDVRSFLGYAQYYRKFVANFAHLAAPLYELTKNKRKFVWTEACTNAFELIKGKLVESPVLAYPTRTDPFILDTDASLYGVGAVLSQIQDGEEKVIAYGSKALSTSQQNYCTTMRELLAVVLFVKQYHHYLWGRHFLVRTDHASLTWLMNFKEPTGMLARWLSMLGNYDFEIQYRKGVSHGNADGLSRQVSRKCKRSDCGQCLTIENGEVNCLVRNNFEQKLEEYGESCCGVVYKITPVMLEQCLPWSVEEVPNMLDQCSPLSVEEVPELSKQCSPWSVEEVSKLCTSSPVSENKVLLLKQNFCDENFELEVLPKLCTFALAYSYIFVMLTWMVSRECKVASTDVNAEVAQVNVVTRSQTNQASGSKQAANSVQRNETALCSNWVNSWSLEEIRKMQQNDSCIDELIKLKTDRTDPPDKDTLSSKDLEFRTLCAQWNYLRVENGLLYRKWVNENSDKDSVLQLVAPKELRKDILHLLHSHKTSGHLGIAKTLGKLRHRFYWPRHKADVERWCKSCKVCEVTNSSLHPKKAPLQQKPVYRRMDRIACDIMGPVDTSENGNSFILVVCDYFSKYTEAYAIPDMTAQTCADKLVTEWICRFGCPVVLHSDQGRMFEAELFKEMCMLLDIHKTRTARYRPNSDGLVERMNRTVKKMLMSYVHENPRSWDEHLPFVLMAYRASIQESTGCTPNLMMFGEENRLPVDIMYYSATVSGSEAPICPNEFVEWLRSVLSQAFEKAILYLKKSAKRQKRLYDQKSFLRQFKVGEFVWILNPAKRIGKFSVAWEGPYLVIQKLSDVNYIIQESPTARKITLHIDHMKAYVHDDTPEPWI